jgi:hypothetical protein
VGRLVTRRRSWGAWPQFETAALAPEIRRGGALLLVVPLAAPVQAAGLLIVNTTDDLNDGTCG